MRSILLVECTQPGTEGWTSYVVYSVGERLSEVSADAMPLYDLMLMVKKGVEKRSVVELLANLGQRMYTTRGGVIDVKDLGRVNLCSASHKRDALSHELNNRVSAGQLRSFSRAVGNEGLESLERETERKAGWMLKALAAITFTYVGFNVFPLMGDSLVKHSVALLRTKDPLFWRSGASRLTLIATDDERRMKIVDAGGVGELVNMLHSASDDYTRREAARALATISQCDAAVEALHKTGVQPFVSTLSTSSSDSETQQHSLILLERLKEWRTRTSQ